MRRNKRPLPIPQHEFGFAPTAFNLIQDSGLDGDRLSRERAEALAARQRAQQAQAGLFVQPATLNSQPA